MDLEQDKTENKLKILHSISRDIQNDQNHKNRSLPISDIKKIR